MENENNTIFIDGFNIRIKAFMFRETYASGLPLKENLHEINKLLAKPDYPLEWGLDITSVVNRNSIKHDTNGLLPKYLYTVWLDSDESINDPLNQYDGSHVICNWFGSAMPVNIPPQQFITQCLINFSWLSYANNKKPIIIKR